LQQDVDDILLIQTMSVDLKWRIIWADLLLLFRDWNGTG